MIGVKEMAMDVSYALGLDGELTLDVLRITERIIQNRIAPKSLSEQALGSMRISRDFRALRQEIAETRIQNCINEGLIVFANEERG